MAPKLFPEERRERIAALLEAEERVAVADLSQRFGVSQVTIRSDLDTLASDGVLVRTHGGAITRSRTDLELSFDVRRRLYSREKRSIGAAAAEMIEDGDAIALDASTTALAVANQIKHRRELTVLTNGIYVALVLLEAPGVTVLMPGGFIRRDSVSLVDGSGEDLIGEYNFQKGFFGVKGLTLEEGLTDVDADEVSVKRNMAARAKRVVAILDHSKLGRVGFVTFASIDQVDCVITDAGADSDILDALRANGIDVVVAPT
jgi:DeoR family transcriptional regulator of aga operon/DeoR family fructose operon transcriptional repressor